MGRFAVFSALLGLGLAAGCSGVSLDGGGSGGSGGAGATNGLPCDVDAVLAKSCRTCHAAEPRYGAPMPLVTRDDLLALAPGMGSHTRVVDAVRARIHDEARPMPPPPNGRLAGNDARTLDAWIDAGAPASNGSCGGAAPSTDGGGAPSLSCTPDTHVRPAAPFHVTRDVEDELVCYGFDTNRTSKRHIVALAPAVGASGVLHHVTLLAADRAVSSTPGPCPSDGMAAWRPLYGWAPGAGALELPPEAGLPDEPDAHLVVQLHYTNPRHVDGVDDASGFDLCTTDQLRPNDADVMAFGTEAITIPAHGSLDVDCSVPVPANGVTTHLFAAFPHMHGLGTSIASTALPAGGGASVDLGTVAHWNVSDQAWLPIDDVLRPGDTVRTTCSWTNTTSHGVGFGPTADDEMCFSFVMYFPKITVPTWNWSLPALYSTCQAR